MYYQDDKEQQNMEILFQGYDGRLRKDNRQVRLATKVEPLLDAYQTWAEKLDLAMGSKVKDPMTTTPETQKEI